MPRVSRLPILALLDEGSPFCVCRCRKKDVPSEPPFAIVTVCNPNDRSGFETNNVSRLLKRDDVFWSFHTNRWTIPTFIPKRVDSRVITILVYVPQVTVTVRSGQLRQAVCIAIVLLSCSRSLVWTHGYTVANFPENVKKTRGIQEITIWLD